MVMLSETLWYLRRIEKRQGFFTSLFPAQRVMSLRDTLMDQFFISIQNLQGETPPEATGRADCRSGDGQFFRPVATPKMRSAIRQSTLPAPKEEKASQMSHLSPSVPPALLC
jgi:hypothetical protein